MQARALGVVLSLVAAPALYGAETTSTKCDDGSLLADVKAKAGRILQCVAEGTGRDALVEGLLTRLTTGTQDRVSAAEILGQLGPVVLGDDRAKAAADALFAAADNETDAVARHAYVTALSRLTPAECARFTSKPPAVRIAPDVLQRDEVAACLDELREHLVRVRESLRVKKTDPPPARSWISRDRVTKDTAGPYAKALHERYRELKAWYRGLGGGNNDAPLAKTRDEAHDFMADEGLRTSVVAEFVPGFVMTDVSQPGTPGTSAPGAEDAAPHGHIRWTTRHFGSEGSNRWDVSLRGRLGFQPALTLVPHQAQANQPETSNSGQPPGGQAPGGQPPAGEPPSEESPAAEAPAPTATFQEAFVFDVGGEVHLHWGPAELSAGAKGGLVRLNSDSTLVDAGANSRIEMPLANGSSRTERFGESGISVRLYQQSREVLHENSLVAPSIEAAVGARWDNRFRQATDGVAFGSPLRRYYARFYLEGIPVRGVPQEDKDKPETFTLTFGVEHEWGSGAEVPAATRFIVAGKLNLLKAIRGR